MRTLLIALMMTLATQAGADVYVSDVDCEDSTVNGAFRMYSSSLEPFWFMSMLPKVSSLSDKANQKWYDENIAKFDKEGSERNLFLKSRFGNLVESYNTPQNPYIRCNVEVILFGSIKSEDYDYLQSYLEKFENDPFLQVNLISGGGEVFSALKIGRLIRRHYGLVNVGLSSYVYEKLESHLGTLDRIIKYSEWLLENLEKKGTEDYKTVLLAYEEVKGRHFSDEPLANILKVGNILQEYEKATGCYSACSLVYVAGISRELSYNPSSRYSIGLHQHFLERGYLEELSVSEAVATLKQTTEEIKIYLDEMGVSEDLLTLASSVAKDDLLTLQDKQLSEIVPFVQAEYGAVIPEKVEAARSSYINFLASTAAHFAKEVPFDVFVSQINKRRAAGDNPMEWGSFNSYHVTSGQASQKFWRER